MKLTFFDIETFNELFCFCGITYDSQTHQELSRLCVRSADNGVVDETAMFKINQYFEQADYIISYNGSRFDLPVLAKMKSDIKRMCYTSTNYIYEDASALISYDDNRNPMTRNFYSVKDWNAKHFDLLNNCLLGKSLKQWEMYLNLPIKELPYDPAMHLSNEMKQEIIDYCFHDVWATSMVYWRFGSGEQKTKFHTLPARKAILEHEWPKNLTFKFDRTAQAVAAGIIYQTNVPIPPKTTDPLELFDLDEFDVPKEVKDIIRLLASTVAVTKKEKMELAEKCVYKGIQFGKGGCHFIREGEQNGLYCFDVQSEYPRIINHWNLLKTPMAIETWKQMMAKRFEIKGKKGTPEYKPDLDLGYKILVLNALSGGFRIRTGTSVAYDPAVGEAMCYIGQLVVTELALACPNWDDVVEINTDSVFVKGEENAKVLRKKSEQMLEKYDMLFEEEFIERAYFRDVNNYGVYDKDGKLLDGRGLDYSDAINKNHEKAVVYELFDNLLRPELHLDWTKYDWTDFIFKWHRAASSKYAAFDGKPFDHKNYYFLWTTRDCPNAGTIQFSNILMDTRNGSIKSRYGVYAFDIKELEQYKGYIDYKQYQRDLDENFWNWERKDLIRTFLGDTKTRRAKGIKTPRSLSELSKLLHPWTENIV
jgi:hypothetical protein